MINFLQAHSADIITTAESFVCGLMAMSRMDVFWLKFRWGSLDLLCWLSSLREKGCYFSQKWKALVFEYPLAETMNVSYKWWLFISSHLNTSLVFRYEPVSQITNEITLMSQLFLIDINEVKWSAHCNFCWSRVSPIILSEITQMSALEFQKRFSKKSQTELVVNPTLILLPITIWTQTFDTSIYSTYTVN